MNTKCSLYKDDEGIKFVRIQLDIDNPYDVSPCLKKLFKQVGDEARYICRFDVKLPYNPDNPRNNKKFPYACLELFIHASIFNFFYREYEKAYKDYDSAGLCINDCGIDSDSTPISRGVPVERLLRWENLSCDTGDLSNRLWNMHFDDVGVGKILN